MRVTRWQVRAILDAAHDIYGDGVKVYLFGSRTDDKGRGGDIDLVVRSRGEPKGVLAKVKMLARLKYLLGDRKIDIIGDHEDNNVSREAVNTGVLLSLGEPLRESETMKTTANSLKERIERECSACERHFMRMEEAIKALGIGLAMSPSQYDTLSEDQVRCIDQFLFRFAKAQDSIGGKLFRYLMTLMGEENEAVPMRDVLDKMERYGIIDSADEWVYIRELRNEIPHEYNSSQADDVDRLGELIGKRMVLQTVYDRLKERIAVYMGYESAVTKGNTTSNAE